MLKLSRVSIARFIKTSFKPKYLSVSTSTSTQFTTTNIETPIDIKQISYIENYTPIDINVMKNSLFGTTTVLKREPEINIKDFLKNGHVLGSSSILLSSCGLMAYNAMFTCDDLQIALIYAGACPFLFSSLHLYTCVQNVKYEWKLKRDSYIEEFDKPVLLLDNWKTRAPYLIPLSILKSHTNVIFGITIDPKEKPLINETIFNIKQFLNTNTNTNTSTSSNHQQFINMHYLQYLNLEQRTRFIDWYVKKHFPKTGAVISSIGYDLEKLYDEKLGCNKLSHIEKLHDGILAKCFKGGEIMENSYKTENLFPNHKRKPMVYDIFSSKKTNSHIVYVDFMEESFDYSNIDSNPITLELCKYSHEILSVDRTSDSADKLSTLYTNLKKLQCYESMYFIDNPEYFTNYIDCFVEENCKHLTHDSECKIYIGFIDDKLKNMYNGVHDIYSIDNDGKKYDLTNIMFSNSKEFTDGYLYAKTGQSIYCNMSSKPNVFTVTHSKSNQLYVNGYICYMTRKPFE